MVKVNVIKGNIWDYNKQGHYVIIPCNKVVKFGKLIMGTGIALQAKIRYPELPSKWKEFVDYGFYIDHDYKLIMICTKNHYRDKSSISNIKLYLDRIIEVVNGYDSLYIKPVQNFMKLIPIYVPKLGCGCGQLNWEKQVKPLLIEMLDERFVLIED